MKKQNLSFSISPLVCLTVLSAIMAGCAAAPTRNGLGGIYTEVTDSITATANAASTKVGESCATNILGAVSTGDISIETAKKMGHITRVASADYKQSSILGVYSKTCIIVHGE